jgi:hypothetical protein
MAAAHTVIAGTLMALAVVGRGSLHATGGATTRLFRGVKTNNIEQFNLAQNGIARPRGGHADPALHNSGNTRSIYTSWTTSRSIAKKYAGKGGIVLEKEIPTYRQVQSPDTFLEKEVLVTHEVSGAKVHQQ